MIVKPETRSVTVRIDERDEVLPNRVLESPVVLLWWPVLRRKRQSQPERCSPVFAAIVHSRYPAATQSRQGPSCRILTRAQERKFGASEGDE
jgi:hypothetical protein